MFTGIISHLGEIVDKKAGKLVFTAPKDIILKLSIGMSIAVDGICLTVVNLNKASNQFEIDFMPETENKTNIRYLKKEDLVNLELPVTVDTLFAGHIVQGHVDTIARILKIAKKENSYIFHFKISEKFTKYIVDKGSIAINGISLTVVKASQDTFTVGIIPHTFKNTMLKKAKTGDYVNIEVDILAKYLEKLVVKL